MIFFPHPTASSVSQRQTPSNAGAPSTIQTSQQQHPRTITSGMEKELDQRDVIIKITDRYHRQRGSGTFPRLPSPMTTRRLGVILEQ